MKTVVIFGFLGVLILCALAVITGASSGIGRGIAKLFAADVEKGCTRLFMSVMSGQRGAFSAMR
jgi:hypothetical protein